MDNRPDLSFRGCTKVRFALGLMSTALSFRKRKHKDGATAEISIRLIEILNCTFDPKPLYQRYIQVVVRAIAESVVGRSSLVVGEAG